MPEYTIAWPEKETMECMVCALWPIARRLVTATAVRMCPESRGYSLTCERSTEDTEQCDATRPIQ